MSFDIVLQRFDGGRADDASVGEVLDPLVTDVGRGWQNLRTSDGGAEVYGTDDAGSGLMFTHAAGTAVWDVIYRIARAGSFAVVLPGCGTAIPDEAMRSSVPGDVPQPVVLVRSGQDLLAMLGAS